MFNISVLFEKRFALRSFISEKSPKIFKVKFYFTKIIRYHFNIFLINDMA